jgi:hypothetical protein
MGKILSLILLFLTSVNCKHSEEKDRTEFIQITNPTFTYSNFSTDLEHLFIYDYSSLTEQDIDSILKKMLTYDQKYREISVRYRKKEIDIKFEDYLHILEKMKRIDSINLKTLYKIVENFGWPDYQRYSDSAVISAKYVLLHNNDVCIKHFKSFIESRFQNCGIVTEDYAILIDRINLSEGEPQTYGTHCIFVNDEKVHFQSIGNINEVEKNRKIIGLDSLQLNTCELVTY